jgi:hypothetical protein
MRILFLIIIVSISQIIGADNWPEFRGPTTDGHAQHPLSGVIRFG